MNIVSLHQANGQTRVRNQATGRLRVTGRATLYAPMTGRISMNGRPLVNQVLSLVMYRLRYSSQDGNPERCRRIQVKTISHDASQRRLS